MTARARRSGMGLRSPSFVSRTQVPPRRFSGSQAMKSSSTLRTRITTMVVIAAFLARSSTLTYAKSPVSLNDFSGTIDFSTTDVSTFTLEGTASHLGRFNAYGEVDFVEDETDGSL